MKRRIRLDNVIEFAEGTATRQVSGNDWSCVGYTGDGDLRPPFISGCHVNAYESPDITLSHLDTAPHLAFVRGTMPPATYADWLQENSVPVPSQVLDLLRS